MTVFLRGERVRVSVSAANAEIFAGGTLARGFLAPPKSALTLPLFDNIWPADPDTLQTQRESMQALLDLQRKPSFRIGSGFHLPVEGFLDQRAKAVSNSRFHGKQVVLNFVYGRCGEPTMCPATASRMMRFRERLPSTTRNKVEFVFITLDPQFDTPARCLEYLKARGANIEGVTMLTGSYEAVEAFSKLCGIWFKKTSDGVLEHAQTTLWADASGTVRDAFPATDEGASSLERSILLETAELTNPTAR